MHLWNASVLVHCAPSVFPGHNRWGGGAADDCRTMGEVFAEDRGEEGMVLNPEGC